MTKDVRCVAVSQVKTQSSRQDEVRDLQRIALEQGRSQKSRKPRSKVVVHCLKLNTKQVVKVDKRNAEACSISMLTGTKFKKAMGCNGHRVVVHWTGVDYDRAQKCRYA